MLHCYIRRCTSCSSLVYAMVCWLTARCLYNETLLSQKHKETYPNAFSREKSSIIQILETNILNIAVVLRSGPWVLTYIVIVHHSTTRYKLIRHQLLCDEIAAMLVKRDRNDATLARIYYFVCILNKDVICMLYFIDMSFQLNDNKRGCLLINIQDTALQSVHISVFTKDNDAYGSGHETATVLLPSFAINW